MNNRPKTPSNPTLPALPPEALKRVCDPASFSFSLTDELPCTVEVIGQDRAVDAIDFGLNIQSPGFNIFVMGPVGTGRRSIVQRIVAEQAAQAPTPNDWVYVNRFNKPGYPRAIGLPAGQGREFRTDMERFNNSLMARLSLAFETDQYAEAREALEQKFRTLQQEELATVDAACRERGFTLVRSASGLYITPVRDGELLTPETFSQLPSDEKARMSQDLDGLEDMLASVMRRLREHERRTQAEVENLDREVADFTVSPLLQDLQTRYADHPEVTKYLDAVRQDVINNVAVFQDEGADEDRDGGRSLLDIPFSQRYQVNLFVDHSRTEGAPVVIEEHPTYEKLFGRIEYDVRNGVTATDHTLIRPGALHRANGGYLVLDAAALLEMPNVWAGLKRAIFRKVICIEVSDGRQLVRTVTPEPEPIPLQVKIILQGMPYIYFALHAYDDDFLKLFKVLADFHPDMERTPENEHAYVQFVRWMCQTEQLMPLTPGAVARIVEHGSRLAEHQERLSTQFGKVADLLREAAYWARRAGHEAVLREDVVTALAQQRRRSNRSEETVRRAMLEGELIVETEGARIGQTSGLTVTSLGEYDYGVPARITARAYVGRGNVVNIHREVDLSGPVHSKGVLTLGGYFGEQYGAQHTLSMEASLNFEQIYDDIDGDSASLAELCVLLSAIGRLPLRQDLALTGSIDQSGRVQSVGGVNEKIEGYFALCCTRGLTGTQGVVIPASNASHLMLDDDVISAVRAGQFHVYPVAMIDDVLPLLFGREAGARDTAGHFPPDSVHGIVAARLRQFAKHAEREDDEDEDE